jgi:superfamily II DNA helicase RecQ
MRRQRRPLPTSRRVIRRTSPGWCTREGSRSRRAPWPTSGSSSGHPLLIGINFRASRQAFFDGEKSRKRKRAPFENEAEEARIDQWERLSKMDSSKQLKRMMGNECEFRGVRKEAINDTTAGESPVVAIMPTGGGKSLLFMLPAFVEQGGTTIVVALFIALRGDMKRRYQKLGISCSEWHSRLPPDAAAVVLVTPEAAVGEAFTTF